MCKCLAGTMASRPGIWLFPSPSLLQTCEDLRRLRQYCRRRACTGERGYGRGSRLSGARAGGLVAGGRSARLSIALSGEVSQLSDDPHLSACFPPPPVTPVKCGPFTRCKRSRQAVPGTSRQYQCLQVSAGNRCISAYATGPPSASRPRRRRAPLESGSLPTLALPRWRSHTPRPPSHRGRRPPPGRRVRDWLDGGSIHHSKTQGILAEARLLGNRTSAQMPRQARCCLTF